MESGSLNLGLKLYLLCITRHEEIVRLHIKPSLGRVGLKKLTPAHVRGLYSEKLDSGLAPATVRKIHSTLHKALSQAVSDGIVPATPPT
jgi:integrase